MIISVENCLNIKNVVLRTLGGILNLPQEVNIFKNIFNNNLPDVVGCAEEVSFHIRGGFIAVSRIGTKI